MSAHGLFVIIMAIILFNFFIEQLLDYLNARHWSDELPEELIGIYDAENYRKSQNYAKTKRKFSALLGLLSTLLILALLYFKAFVFLDDYLRTVTQNQILLSLLFFGSIGLAAELLSIPFGIYHTFVIEAKFGFNKTNARTYILDKLKGWLLAIVIGGGLLALIIWIYTVTGSAFWLLVWGVMSLFMIFMNMFYSNLIVPLFNKQIPLPDGELRTRIEAFAKKSGFALNNIFVIDGSKRSSKANAYFSGLGHKKRIVLFDTLIKEHSVDEVVAVLAHEIGHYKKKHTLYGMAVSMAQTGLMLFVLSVLIGNPVLADSLGVTVPSFHIGVLVFGILYSPVSLILGLITNYISRKNEYEADRFAADHYCSVSLQNALKKLSVNNLSNLKPHPVYEFFYYTHPSLLKRLRALKLLERDLSD